MSDKMTRREWLDSLEPGDKVIYEDRLDSCLKTVKRITKTQIVLESGSKFRRKDGSLVGGGEWCQTMITEPTPAKVEKIIRDRTLRKLSRVRFQDLSDDVLAEIVYILKERGVWA